MSAMRPVEIALNVQIGAFDVEIAVERIFSRFELPYDVFLPEFLNKRQIYVVFGL